MKAGIALFCLVALLLASVQAKVVAHDGSAAPIGLNIGQPAPALPWRISSVMNNPPPHSRVRRVRYFSFSLSRLVTVLQSAARAAANRKGKIQRPRHQTGCDQL